MQGKHILNFITGTYLYEGQSLWTFAILLFMAKMTDGTDILNEKNKIKFLCIYCLS